ncbi:YicC/YloC family endoribonuclease [Fusibacter ferrireducens]|uniref:YicC family protein n=1 Tax=Fusibacter ferrireducens TaxID=2785058 RepID=A0ABR9ZP15_9FIRM|nr:YicC/YloC family endoribonuclease [Fusibacter ferrireducens]MBF4691665.1 YicC family protein [Fusibacter ferrireducens]
MIYSMTGFGRGEFSNDAFDITLEIKSVNNRYCDIIVKMPKKLNVFEDRIKNTIKGQLSRGRIDVYINLDEKSYDNYEVLANFDILDKYVNVYREIKSRYEIKDDVTLSMLTRIQEGIDVSYLERGEEEYWAAIEPALNTAIENILEMRRQEGQKLKEDIHEKTEHIRSILSKIEVMTPQILEAYRVKMRDRIAELLKELNAEIDEARLANELAIYADKTNINEEIVRIYSHLAQINTILESSEPIGRKLDFLIQELNREVNTIGSKSPDIDISNLVIDLKSEIEQIREQIQNIE